MGTKRKTSKLIVILGLTASGKTALSIKLAKKFNGEIISADSRQIYKKMDIGTGKVTKKEMEGIPHHLLDVAHPKKKFSVAQYQQLSRKAIKQILKKQKLPFLTGGSAFYIHAATEGIIMPRLKPDWVLRKKLEKKTTKELFKKLKQADPRRAKTIDPKNKRRLIRAMEIIMKTKKPVPLLRKDPLSAQVLFLGIKKPQKELKELIRARLLKRMKKGMVAEVKKLKKSGISWKRLEEFGLEYRFIAQHLQNKLSYDEMISTLQKEIEHFSKRQMTWFKKNRKIHWIKNQRQAEKLIKKFLVS